MASIIRDFEQYLSDLLGVKVASMSWDIQDSMPFFLQEQYSFYEIILMDHPYVIMINNGEDEVAPTELCKHMEKIHEKWKGTCVYVHTMISSYHRKRLVENRVPFVIPGNQMYLPDLGIDFRERFTKTRSNVTLFSPATQAMVIYFLTNRKMEKVTPSLLARQLNVSVMTMSRALDELEGISGIDISRKGRERIVHISEDRKILWENTRGFMRSPTKRIRYCQKKHEIPDGFIVIAGLSALSRYSLLQSPSLPEYAISYRNFNKVKFYEPVRSVEEADCSLQVWFYDPTLFTQDGVADPFSLYLSLQEEASDERVETALDEMMEAISW